jgi:hypothetical protein
MHPQKTPSLVAQPFTVLRPQRRNNIFRRACVIFAIFCLFQCTEDEILKTDTEGTQGRALSNCGCTYNVPAGKHKIDGLALGIKPGAVICLQAGTAYKNLLFVNIKGTQDKPITIKNCGGSININATGMTFAMKTQQSEYFRITGTGSSAFHGIKLYGSSLGLTLDYLSTKFEVDHIEVHRVNFAGIMAKTDPTCDNATTRENFTMRDIVIHDNFVHDTGGEALYIGNSFYQGGMITPCGIRYPHAIEGASIYKNKVQNSGWEGIQVGSATKKVYIHSNTVENYGTRNVYNQRNGIQLGEGTGGECFNNFIKSGLGNGILVLGLGDNVVHDNVIVNAGMHGIFCDERLTPGPGFKFINNTIINPKQDGIRIYADLVPMNVVFNNIIINPGSYGKYPYPRTGNDSYVYKLSNNVKLQLSNNKFTRSITQMKFVNPSANNYRLSVGSPAIDQGKNISTYNIQKDFYLTSRLKGGAYDVGACEY